MSIVALMLATEELKNSYSFTKRINSGIVVFGIFSAYGLTFLIKGLRDDIYDWLGERRAPRWSYIAFGLVCQVPLGVFLAFLARQGYFTK
jgi:hypothetical protein